MNERPTLYLLIPAALLVVAILPLPYGFYMFLRLVVTVAAASVAYAEYQSSRSLSWRVVLMGLVALLFNPIVTVALSRSIWLPIDLLTAGLFAYMALKKERPSGA